MKSPSDRSPARGDAAAPKAADMADAALSALTSAQGTGDCGDLVKVAKMAKAIAEMELGFAASPDFSAREMLDAANEALAAPSTNGATP